MALTDINVASRALVMIGANPISDFDGGSTEAIVAKNIYEGVVEAALTWKRWRFAIGQEDLAAVVATPKARWDTAFALPGDPAPIAIHAVTVNSIPILYDRYENYIYCNATANDTVTLDYTYRADVSLWMPYFTKAVSLDLASIFAGSLAANGKLAQEYGAMAERAYVKAGTIEAQSQTTKRVQSRKLITVRS